MHWVLPLRGMPQSGPMWARLLGPRLSKLVVPILGNKLPSPRSTRPKVVVAGPSRSGPPTPPVALSRVLNLESEEPVYRSSEGEVEYQARDGSPHSHRSGERDTPSMNVDEASWVGRNRRLTLTEVKAWSFGKVEGLTRPSLPQTFVLQLP